MTKTDRAVFAANLQPACGHHRVITGPLSHLMHVGHTLIRLESVASSKIEHLDASVADYARAIAGSRAKQSATAMVAASVAIHDMIDRVERDTRLTREMLLTAHTALLGDDPHEAAFAGRVRTMQNWIGGSDYSPATRSTSRPRRRPSTTISTTCSPSPTATTCRR
ncbi:hypothetical protein VD659_07970 [Herbiconiux sp. 11R-BC]|uniref:hypothetical protein n=1 Tax=Herbiconiux sp. 11R-BC TaxID=3111637 RepID=UPI003BFEB08C